MRKPGVLLALGISVQGRWEMGRSWALGTACLVPSFCPLSRGQTLSLKDDMLPGGDLPLVSTCVWTYTYTPYTPHMHTTSHTHIYTHHSYIHIHAPHTNTSHTQIHTHITDTYTPHTLRYTYTFTYTQIYTHTCMHTPNTYACPIHT